MSLCAGSAPLPSACCAAVPSPLCPALPPAPTPIPTLHTHTCAAAPDIHTAFIHMLIGPAAPPYTHPPAGEAGHLLWVRDPSQPDLASQPADMAEALTLREQQQQIEVRRVPPFCLILQSCRGLLAPGEPAEAAQRQALASACCDTVSVLPSAPHHAAHPGPPRQICFPGAYRCVCVELRIAHLAVCAVLEAATLGELEGSALGDDQHGCAAAFRCGAHKAPKVGGGVRQPLRACCTGGRRRGEQRKQRQRPHRIVLAPPNRGVAPEPSGVARRWLMDGQAVCARCCRTATGSLSAPAGVGRRLCTPLHGSSVPATPAGAPARLQGAEEPCAKLDGRRLQAQQHVGAAPTAAARACQRWPAALACNAGQRPALPTTLGHGLASL